MKVLLVQLYFATASRPSELVATSKKEFKNALKLKDIKSPRKNEKFQDYIQINIRNFKNQKSKKIFKTINLGDTKCNVKSCERCIVFNPKALLDRYIKKRYNLVKKLKIE